MAVRSIVIVAFPGVQALDITGPHEVFADGHQCARRPWPARRVPHHRRRQGARLHPQRERARPPRRPARQRHRPDRHDADPGRERGRCRGTRRRAHRLDQPAVATPDRHRVQRSDARGCRWRDRRPAGHDPLGEGVEAGRCASRSRRRRRSRLHPRRPGLVIRRSHRGDRPRARTGTRGRWRRRRPDRRSLAGDVPAPAREPIAVRRPGVDQARR